MLSLKLFAESGVIQFSQNSAWLPGFSENATIPFEAGSTYRLRLINMSGLGERFGLIYASVHRLTIVGSHVPLLDRRSRYASH